MVVALWVIGLRGVLERAGQTSSSLGPPPPLAKPGFGERGAAARGGEGA
jgi:hypothetical protein